MKDRIVSGATWRYILENDKRNNRQDSNAYQNALILLGLNSNKEYIHSGKKAQKLGIEGLRYGDRFTEIALPTRVLLEHVPFTKEIIGKTINILKMYTNVADEYFDMLKDAPNTYSENSHNDTD